MALQAPTDSAYETQDAPAPGHQRRHDGAEAGQTSTRAISPSSTHRLARGGPLPAIALGILVVALWELLTRSGDIAAYLLPPPIDVLRSFVREWGNGFFWHYTRTTLVESVVGLGIGTAVAIPIGIL